VRKVAAIALNEMIKLMPKVPEQELLKIFGQFFKDEQDSVKMQGIDSCVIFSKCMTAQVRLLQYIQKYLENKSGGSLIDNRFLNLRILLVSLSVYILFIVHEKL